MSTQEVFTLRLVLSQEDNKVSVKLDRRLLDLENCGDGIFKPKASVLDSEISFIKPLVSITRFGDYNATLSFMEKPNKYVLVESVEILKRILDKFIKEEQLNLLNRYALQRKALSSDIGDITSRDFIENIADLELW